MQMEMYIEDKIDDYTINTQNITYDKNLDRIITEGNTEAIIQSSTNSFQVMFYWIEN